MTDDLELGVVNREGDCWTATLTRRLEHEREAVWQMLTVPDRIVEWLAPGEIELRSGGAAKLDFTDSGTVIDSTVTTFEPLETLEYSWSSPGEPDRPVRWELADAEGGVQLTLKLGIPATEDIARSCAGWEAHLMMLLAAIEGVPIKFPFERFVETRGLYNKMIEA